MKCYDKCTYLLILIDRSSVVSIFKVCIQAECYVERHSTYEFKENNVMSNSVCLYSVCMYTSEKD